MSLIAAELERNDIATVCVILLRFVAEKVRPPRALYVPFRHGYPLGEPHRAALQRDVVLSALRLLELDAKPPLLADFPTPRGAA